MAKILVTGGAGFIGSHLVDKLIELGQNVTIIDDLSSGNEKFINKRAKFFKRDIKEDLTDIFEEGFDYVFHLAAQIDLRKSLQNPKEDATINIVGSLNVIENCYKRKIKKIIFSSTGGAIYSSNEQLPCTELSKADPISPYGLAKLTIEKYLNITKEVFGLDYVALRYSNVYGPRQNIKGEAGVISIFIKNVLAGKDLLLNGDGNQTRDFVYVSDVVHANIIAMEKLSGTYNVSTGKETSINDIANSIKQIMDSDCNIIHKEAIKGELLRSCLDSGKLRKDGWKPNYALDNGLKETIDWFRENY